MFPRQIVATAFEGLADLFFPRHCAGCGSALDAGWFCLSCREAVRPIQPPRCQKCSHPSSGAREDFVCENCRDRAFYFESAVSVMPCRGFVRELIHRLKYSGELWLSGPLGEFLTLGLEDERLRGRNFDEIVPVPLHPKRQRERGFNQAEVIARELVVAQRGRLGNLLQRTRYTVTQTHFDRHQRMQNLRDAFSMRHNADVQGKHLLLVDDVLTTGSTLNECARVLRQAGAASVCALTVARG